MEIQSKINTISFSLLFNFWQTYEFDFLRSEQLDDKKFYFILFLSSIRFYRSIFLSVTLYISPAMNWQVAVTTGEKAEWEAIC